MEDRARARAGPRRTRVVVYVKAGPCPLCDEAEAVLDELALARPLDLETVVVDGDPDLVRRHALRVPVVEVEGREVAFGRIRREDLARWLPEGPLDATKPPGTVDGMG